MALALLGGTFAHGQYRFTRWTTDSGLPQNSVRGLVQTPDGYIWVATLSGVARFDGVRFTVFDKSNSPGIGSSRFVAMVHGQEDDLWLVSEDGNVVVRHAGKFTAIGEAQGLPTYSVSAITADGHGGVWVSSHGHVLRWNAPRSRFIRELALEDHLEFGPLWWVGTGFWALDGRDIVCFDHGEVKRIALPTEIASDAIYGVAAGADGAIWARTIGDHLGRFYKGQFSYKSEPYLTPMQNPAEANWNVEVSNDRLQQTLHFPTDGEDRPIRYNVLMRDNEGNLWVGSEGDGLFRIQKQSIRTLSQAQGLASNNVYPILHARFGDMWVGSWPAGLTEIRDGHVVQVFTKKDGLPDLVTSLAEDREGMLWVGTHGGVRNLVNGKLVEPKLKLEWGMPVSQVIHQAPDGTMLFGTPRGLYLVTDARSRRMTKADGLAADDVRTIITDRKGDLWIGGYGGLTRSHDGQLTRWTEANGLPSNNVRSILEDRYGEIWVGTYDGGIGWLRNGRWVVFNAQNGLFDNGAFQILEGRNGHMWISSNRGLYRVNREQLAAVADGREGYVNSIAYGVGDGMLNAECNGGLWPAGAKDSDGSLWFPTQMGVAIVDPVQVRVVQQAPKVLVEGFLIDHKPQPSSGEVTLHPNQANLEVDYTALSYSKPEQLTFRYKLDGIDDDWESVGLRRTAYFSHLPAGAYTFRVSALNSDGVRSQSDATLHITVIPPFYRRPWFRAFLVVLFLGLLSLLWNLRVRQLRMEQARQQQFSRELIASQEGERRRIAAELHDSLGQRLIIINNLALFLLRTKGKVRTEEEKQETIGEISEEASAAIEETRAISYALRPFQLDRLGLTRAIKALCNTVSKGSDVEVSADLEDIDEAFPEHLRINVYRILQEALNNVVKHAHATQATVSARRTASDVTLTISDNGRGLPVEPKAASSGPGGFGMTGMRERATLLNGTLQIKSTAGTGTLVTLQLPIQSESAA